MGECAGVVKPFLSGRQTRKHWIKASPRASLLLYLFHRDQLVCMNVHIHEKYKSKGTRCRNTAPQSSVAIHLLSLCHSPSVEPIWFIISWMEQFALRSRGCAGRDEPSAPLYLIRPYFYCCCHGDIHLSAEASASTSPTIWLVDSILTGSGWVVSTPTEVLGGQFRSVDGQLIQEQLRMRLRCSELTRQLQVLIDRCDYGFRQSGWHASCHFEFKVLS